MRWTFLRLMAWPSVVAVGKTTEHWGAKVNHFSKKPDLALLWNQSSAIETFDVRPALWTFCKLSFICQAWDPLWR
jgi:hypothetical protein